MHTPKYPNLNSSKYGLCFFTTHDSVMIVRNPYARFFSYYYDKHVRSALFHNSSASIPAISEVVKSLKLIGCDEHYCPQTSLCSYKQLQYKYVLKVEQMSLWYPSMVNKFNLSEIVMQGWNNIGESHSSRDSCFYHPRVMSCSEYHRLDYPVTNQFDVCNFTNPRHSRCSVSHMEDLDEQVVDALTLFYMEDLEAFNYPTWNGKSENFRPVYESGEDDLI